MDLIKTGIGITKTIKNYQRLREIISVLYRNGFTDILQKANLLHKVPGFVIPKNTEPTPEDIKSAAWPKLIGYQLRKSFEELGPSFVKIGQLLSTREDIFPAEFVEEMKILQDKAKPITFDEAREVIEKRLNKKIEQVFESIDPHPIGMASIGVVYKAKLKSGEDVVVKVRRPRIEKVIIADFELVRFLVGQVEKASEEIRFLGVGKVLEDFSKSLSFELDFRIEASNSERIANNIKAVDPEALFHIPKVFREYSGEDVLVMEFVKGTPFNKITKNHPKIEEIHHAMVKSVHVFVKTLLIDGFFHADLHGGNFFLMDNGQIGIIDFGLMGTLGKKSRENLIAILYSISKNNYENLVYEFLDVAEYDKIPDIDLLVREIKDSLVPYVGLSVQDTNFSAMLRAMVGTLARHQIYLPREWFIIFRALVALDGVGKSIDIDINLFEVLNEDIDNLIKNMLSKEAAMEEAIWVGRDLLSSIRMFPRHMRWFLKEFSRKNYAIEVRVSGHEKQLKYLTNSVNFLGICILASFIGYSGSTFIDKTPPITTQSIPNLTWGLWIISALLFFRSLWKIRHK